MGFFWDTCWQAVSPRLFLSLSHHLILSRPFRLILVFSLADLSSTAIFELGTSIAHLDAFVISPRHPSSKTISPRRKKEKILDSSVIYPRRKKEKIVDASVISPRRKKEKILDASVIYPRRKKEKILDTSVISPRRKKEKILDASISLSLAHLDEEAPHISHRPGTLVDDEIKTKGGSINGGSSKQDNVCNSASWIKADGIDHQGRGVHLLE